MTDPSDDQPSPEGLAFDWVSRILAVVAEMVLPGLAGQWLDHRWGTKFLALLGFGLGISLGIWHLLVMTAATQRKSSKPNRSEDSKKSHDDSKS